MAFRDPPSQPLRSTKDIYNNILGRLKDIQPSTNVRLSAVAHARPSLDVRPPAFCRHMFFFFPYREPESHVLLYPGEFDRPAAAAAIKKMLSSIFKQDIAQLNGVASDFEKFFRIDETYISTTLPFMGFDFRITVDIYSEYCSITFMLDNLSDCALIDTPTAAAARLRSVINNEMPQYSGGLKSYSDVEIVYFGIWEALTHYYNIQFDEKMGRLFGDGRGLVFCPLPTSLSTNGLAGLDASFIPSSVRICEKSDMQEFFRHNQQFFFECLGLQSDGMHIHPKLNLKRVEPNIILSHLLGANALYGSALGNEFALKRSPGDPIPINYFVIYNGQSSNQLGRLIRRQYTLGELRLAALLDRETIVLLGTPIRLLGGLVSKLVGYGTRFGTVGKREFNDAADAFMKIGAKCHGGLLYRINRSSYYYEALISKLKDMDYQRIEGWQSYDDFVIRYFDQQFKSMHALGERYREIGKRIDNLMGIYNFERQRITSVIPMIIAYMSLALAAAVALIRPAQKIFGHIFGTMSVLALLICIAMALYFLIRMKPKDIASSVETDQTDEDRTSTVKQNGAGEKTASNLT